jgi:hypothetical protein
VAFCEKEKGMTESGGKAKEIVLGDEFGDIAVKANGVRVEIHTDGSIAAYTNSDVDAYTSGAVRVHAAANDDTLAVSVNPQIGDKMPAGHPQAGWIYAGVSKTTHQSLYVAPKDSGVFQWKAAMAFAAKEGARVPSRDELCQIRDAMDKGALKGTFNVTGSNSNGWYWSCAPNGNLFAWARRFSDGVQDYGSKYDDSSLRCVR